MTTAETIATVLAAHESCPCSQSGGGFARFWMACEGCDWLSESTPSRDSEVHAAAHRAHVAAAIAEALGSSDDGLRAREAALLRRLRRAHEMGCSDPSEPTKRTMYSEAADAIEALVLRAAIAGPTS